MLNFRSVKCITCIILIILLACPSITSARHQDQCYYQNDVNASNTVTIHSNPKELLSTTPQIQQVASWVDTSLISIGGTKAGTFTITGSIRGSWGPLGSASIACNLADCNSGSAGIGSNEVQSMCLTKDTQNIKYNGQNVHITRTTYPCILSNGVGLYMLITNETDNALSANYSPQQIINSDNNVTQITSNALNPNQNILSSALPTNGEYFIPTWHIGDYVTTSSDKNAQFTIKNATKCKMLPNSWSCITESIPSGRIYLKIIDSYYGDNYGSYTITFNTGVFQVGFLFRAIQIFDTILDNSSKLIATYVSKTLQPIFMLILTFYIIWYGIAFLTGVLEVKIHDMVMRMIKLCTVSLLFTPQGLLTVERYLIDPFWTLGSAISDIILMSVVFNATTGDVPTLSTAAETVMSKLWYIAIYDSILNILYSSPINAKIWGILFSLKFYYIILLYALTIVLTFSIFKAFLYSLDAMIRFYLIKTVFPLFMVISIIPTLEDFLMTLFKQLTVVAITLILIALSSALMIVMLDTSFKSLYNYTVCWRPIINLPVLDLLKFFMTSPYAEAKEALKFDVYMYTIVTAVLFYELFDKLGDLINGLSNVTSSIDETAQHTNAQFTNLRNKVQNKMKKLIFGENDSTKKQQDKDSKDNKSKVSRDDVSDNSSGEDSKQELNTQKSDSSQKRQESSSQSKNGEISPQKDSKFHSNNLERTPEIPEHDYFDDAVEDSSLEYGDIKLTEDLKRDSKELSVEEKLTQLQEQLKNSSSKKSKHVNRDGEGSGSEEDGEFADRESNAFHEQGNSKDNAAINRDDGSVQNSNEDEDNTNREN
ncbi:hypothetical protein [Candidatus Fokinia crypta]|uniref:Type IV secretion system protein VirB6 n=1 Tax=Candidatus Fokinia crypta TaxID=1920990 RepID=A0ABZ0UU22_9RICK|nr:hypothetical protein [Candidatus Fokinia cryptica]WPX98188.1 Type IV secretion system protein VirB6 [Candidatus Fokinia cryptica]